MDTLRAVAVQIQVQSIQAKRYGPTNATDAALMSLATKLGSSGLHKAKQMAYNSKAFGAAETSLLFDYYFDYLANNSNSWAGDFMVLITAAGNASVLLMHCQCSASAVYC